MDLLRLATAGSVDDGKSTLIGRLLLDSKSVLSDQLAALEQVRLRRADDAIDLSLLTDGLKAEREQGITIDVAYRYFATARRKFILADTPGHVQYTRNMITGASSADLAIVLVDARKGLLEQTRRHAFLCSLMGLRHLVICVNKMDLVGYSEQTFDAIRSAFDAFSAKLQIHDVAFIPVSALLGDNVVHRSANMAWYQGAPLLAHLEHVHVSSDRDLIDPRFAVQLVLKPQVGDQRDYRGYAGSVTSGVFRVGEEVVALPSGLSTRIEAIDTFAGPIPEAFAPQAVTLRLRDEIDLNRGDMLCKPANQPRVEQDLDVMLCWMDDKPLDATRRFALLHTTNDVRVVIKEVLYTLDINTLHRTDSRALLPNDIARVRLRTARPILCDSYRRNRSTGSVLLVDETTHATAAAGMILDP